MKLVREILIFGITVGASVFAGASAHNAGHSAYAGCAAHNDSQDDNIFTGLVRTVNDGKKAVPDTVTPKVITDPGTRYVVVFSEEEAAALSKPNSLKALDFVADVYESNDFYESGYWGKDGHTFTSDIYTGRLPEYTDKDFIRPVKGGEFTSVFGYREKYGRMHKGVDISLNVGDVVCAALPGVVGRIGYERGGYGHFVIVVHSDGVETRYAHLSRVTASVGQRVSAGEAIALGGNTGNSTGPHLHFEVRKQGKAIDPLLVFGF